MPQENLFLICQNSEEGPVIKIAEIAKNCPEEFKQDSPWTKFASELQDKKVDLDIWPWKAMDEKRRQLQLDCLDKVFDSSHEDKYPIAGWMLSEMLESIPENSVSLFV